MKQNQASKEERLVKSQLLKRNKPLNSYFLIQLQANILVSSQGACSQAIVNAGGQAMRENLVTPNTGDITVTRGSGKLACDHVIHVNCSEWHGGTGEWVGI